jgi:hypothetical protein
MLAKARLREDAERVYRAPDVAFARIVAAAESGQSSDALYLRVAERPERFGELRGEVSYWLKRPSAERVEAGRAAMRLASDASDLVLVEQTAKRDLERSWDEERRRVAVGIPMPSTDLALALGAGVAGASIIAARAELLQEKRRLELALHERFSAEERRVFQDSRASDLARRYRIADRQAGAVQAVAREMAVVSPAVEREVEARLRAETTQSLAR